MYVCKILFKHGKSSVEYCKLKTKTIYSKWFEPRSISNLSSVIVRVSVVLKRTVGDDSD